MNAIVYQIFYNKNQISYLDQAFRPLDVSLHNCPKWCEYRVFIDYSDFVIDCADEVYGFVSWKFFMKTHLRGDVLFRAVSEAEIADVYFINPYETSVAGLYKNVWTQLESVFPGVMPVVQKCFYEAGYNLDLSKMIMSKDQMSFCNYWLGTKAFWEEYMTFTRPLYDYLELQLNQKTLKYFVKLDQKNRLGLFPHIMERMFSTLLVVYQNQFKAIRIPLPASIKEIDPEVITACNRVKTQMIDWDNESASQAVLDSQDLVLSRLLKYKQTSEKAMSKGTVSKLMSVVIEKIGL